MKTILLTGLAGISAFSFSGCDSGNKDIKKPNIIFILGDDLGYADLGCYGQKITETPNIDALARQGVMFTNYYSGSPVSAPSRCVLLTGKHTGHAYIRGNNEWAERGDVWDFQKMEADPSLEGQYPIPANTLTYSKILQQNGYTTACIGKWGLGAPASEGVPGKQGFDLFFGYNCQRQAHTYYPKHLWRNDDKIQLDNEFIIPHTFELDGDKDPLNPGSYSRYSQKEYAPELMLKEILGFIEVSRDKPFFLSYTTIIPHVPMQAPAEWVEKYHQKIGDEKPYLGQERYFPNRYPLATYAAMVSYLDFQVGEIVNKLKELGLYENTVIIFSSDNGPVIIGGSRSDFFENARPFNQNANRLKGTVYEGGIHVPLIVSWPKKIKQSSISDHICAAWDIFPTLCEITGSELPAGLDGISILPSVTGKGKQKKHEFLYWEYPEKRGQQAVRLGDWKGIRDSTRDGKMNISLYNLKDDSMEIHDLSAQNPGIVERIEKIMAAEHLEPEVEKFFIFKK